MASKVLDCFPKLLKDNTNERLDGGCKLLQHLSIETQVTFCDVDNLKNRDTFAESY